MSGEPKDWIRVSPKEPCRICKRVDWCCRGEIFDNCMRVESDRPAKNGGWLHKIDATAPAYIAPPLRRPVARPVNIDWNYRERQYTPPDGKVKALADAAREVGLKF